jgi:transposase
MPRPRRFFPPEYKAEVAELIRSTGKTVGRVARELDLTETAVRQWVRQADPEVVGLLALVAGQDVEPGEQDGSWRIARKVPRSGHLGGGP